MVAEALEKASVKKAQRKPKPTTPHPRVVVAGFNELRVERVTRSLARIRARIEKHTREGISARVSDRAAAVVLVDPIGRMTMSAAIETLRQQSDNADLPIFAVVDEGASTRRALSLYIAGASAVFEWPSEAGVMADLFAETFGIVRVRGRAAEPDRALSRAVRGRLRLYPELPASVKVFAQAGLVSVAADDSTLASKAESASSNESTVSDAVETAVKLASNAGSAGVLSPIT